MLGYLGLNTESAIVPRAVLGIMEVHAGLIFRIAIVQAFVDMNVAGECPGRFFGCIERAKVCRFTCKRVPTIYRMH